MDFQSFQMNMEILSDVLGMTSFLATVLLYMSIKVAGITSLMKDRKKLFYIKEQYEKNKQSTYGNQEQSWQIFLLTIARSTLLCYLPKKDNKNKKTKECFIKNSISSSCFPAIFFPFTVSYCHTYTETDLVGTI